ncbi:hypothetical protein D9M69_581230 [compost metagenome]
MSALKKAISDAGGVAAVAGVCGLSQRAVYKWLAADALPRTEYTGETDYARRLAASAADRGVMVDAEELREQARPHTREADNPKARAKEGIQ